VWSLIKESLTQWSEDYAPSMGAALAYYTIFSIAPLLVIAIAVAGFFFGQDAASGEIFDMHHLTAAHPSLPLGTRLLVTNVANGRSVVVRVNDRGPYRRGRIPDLSYAAARALHAVEAGVINVRVAVVDR